MPKENEFTTGSEMLPAAPVNEDELAEEGLSHDLDFITIHSDQGTAAEMEAISIQSLLEANDMPCTVVGSRRIPIIAVRGPRAEGPHAGGASPSERHARSSSGGVGWHARKTNFPSTLSLKRCWTMR